MTASALLLTMASCTSTAPPGHSAIRSAIKGLEEVSIGRVTCKHEHVDRDPLSTVPYKYTIGFTGAGNLESAVADLQSRDFRLRTDLSFNGYSTLIGPDKIRATVSSLPSDEAGQKMSFDQDYKCRVPADGMVVVSIVPN
jgi:hypothetical protein